MKQQNLTKEGHVLHAFTERDEVVVQLTDGSVHKAPMHYAERTKRICYTVLDCVFALPGNLQVRLSN